ncbi:Fe-S cluster assembly protein SufD [Maricaulis sp.]|uniref:Fe-S cluster assembly protein SufD n=1 Tax=Maricaulis sp. TaxID=1486257 RepID=UPI00261BCF83|nr:Fe-S cluster assembly protein SufD [Maricaulis sp.]
MGAITHTPAEKTLIDLLDGAEDWRAAARDAVVRFGLPTKRAEAWKWSDLRRASQGIETAGQARFLINGETAADRLTVSEDAALELVAEPGISVASLEIDVPAGARVVLKERYKLADGAFPTARLEISLGEGAVLERVVLGDTPQDSIPVVRTRIRVSKQSHYRQIALTFGSKLTRNETHITHAGEGAEVEIGGVYLLEEGRHADFTSTVSHTGPGGVTHQLVKGAAAAQAQGVFQGKFKVEQAAQQTDAKMTHRALMLDDRAEIDAKPELEIYADDVQCAHGNALGAIDETALFYMRQRGLSEVKARAMLIESFLAEPLDMISDDVLRDELAAILRQRLGAIG